MIYPWKKVVFCGFLSFSTQKTFFDSLGANKYITFKFRKSQICDLFDRAHYLCYSFVVKLGGCFLGSTVTAVLGVLLKGAKFVGEFVGKLIYYFGLYFPILYALYGVVLYLVFDFNPFLLDVNGKLFMFGFALSLLAMVIKAVKNLIVNPYRKHFQRSHVVEYGKEQKLSKHAPEAPTIYKSKVNPGVIVYEYSNRFDLYEEDEDGLRLVDTEYKEQKGRRW